MALWLGSGCQKDAPMGPAFAELSTSTSFIDSVSSPPAAAFDSHEFGAAESCAGCHPQHYAEWRSTAHAHAMEDPVFLALIARQREAAGGRFDRLCTQCHSNIGTRSGEIQPGFELGWLSQVVREGVTCNGCHRITSVVRDHNAGHVLDPNAPIQGPYGDVGIAHLVEHNPLMESSALCGSCHDVNVAGMTLESPYAEWKKSPAAQRGQTCQGCHMPAYRGTAAKLPGVSERTLHRHTFTGVEVPFGVPQGEEREALEVASDALLASAIGLGIERMPSTSAQGEFAFEVILVNHVDGHRVPTGSSFFRQCWVSVEVEDAEGRLLFESGQVDREGDLYDALHPDATRDPSLYMLSAHLVDDTDTQVLFPFQAARRVDLSLAPLESRRVRYQTRIGGEASWPLTVRASVRFRPFAPRLLRELGLDELARKLRMVDMASVSKQVDLAFTQKM